MADKVKTIDPATGKRRPEYESFKHMKCRCTNKNNQDYLYYGGRGIAVYDAWLNRDGFTHFFNYLGPKPSTKHSLDRINVNGNYEPGNVRWATPKEQHANRRNACNLILLSYNGQTKNMTQWAKYLKISQDTLWARINKYNWPVEKALSQKIRGAA